MSSKNDYFDSDDDESSIPTGERTVKIKELDLNTLYPRHIGDMKQGAKYIIIGKPGSGKSTLIKAILYAKKHIFPCGSAWSGSEDSNGFFGEFMPKLFIYNGLNVDDLSSQERFRERQKIARKFLEPRKDISWAFNCVDDCTSDVKFLTKEVMRDLYKNGRHKALIHLLGLQYCLDIKPDIRVCIDGTFILRESSPIMRKKLFENYGSCVESQADWNELMDQLTTDYMAMFVNNKATSNKLEDCISFIRVDPDSIPKDWKIGCREYWEFANERYDPTSEMRV